MCAEKKEKQKEYINAIDYIKNSQIFSNEKYLWFIPLIEKVLEEKLEVDDIDSLLGAITSNIEKQENDDKKLKNDEVKETPKDDKKNGYNSSIQKICRINKILNVGLIEIANDGIELRGGLNVFYGKNGAGKSSVYLGLCKALGKEKSVFSNANNDCQDSCCNITCSNDEGQEYCIEWKTGDVLDNELNVKIFDGAISNFIIKEDQVNQFQMAHLKIEYFSFLHDLYDNLEYKINEGIIKIRNSIQVIEKLLNNNVPFIFNTDYELNINAIESAVLSEDEQKKISKIEDQIKKITDVNIQSLIKNINNSVDEIRSVLLPFGCLSEAEDKNGLKSKKWILKYKKEYCEEINKKITDFLSLKKDFENSGNNKISKLIPKNWIGNEKWEKFISSSIDFLNTLNGKDGLDIYQSEKCIYCHQPLETQEAKNLIKAYQDIYSEHKEKIEISGEELKNISIELGNCLMVINAIAEKNSKIESEFEAINKKGDKINFEFEKLRILFQSFKDSVDQKNSIRVIDAVLIESFWTAYSNLFVLYKNKLDKLNRTSADKTSEIDRLNKLVTPLKQKSDLIANKNNLIQYVKDKKVLEELENKNNNLTLLRQYTSTLRTSFSQQAILAEFEKNLKKENDNLGFNPPTRWSIKPFTRGGINKRTYNIGDKKLSDIFSEGEQKLHALSDFFAQSESDKFKGVYIFDDPVNSLDEGNIELVANRLLKLVDDGNQVIIFTHNLIFLYSLIRDVNKNKIVRIERHRNQIIIEPNICIGNNQKLKERMANIDSSIKEISEVSEHLIPEYKLKNVYDLISGYLEDYVEVVYLKNIINRYRPNIPMHSLENLKSIQLGFIDNILSFYEKTSRLGTRHSQPHGTICPNYQNLLDDVRDLKQNFKY